MKGTMRALQKDLSVMSVTMKESTGDRHGSLRRYRVQGMLVVMV